MKRSGYGSDDSYIHVGLTRVEPQHARVIEVDQEIFATWGKYGLFLLFKGSFLRKFSLLFENRLLFPDYKKNKDGLKLSKVDVRATDKEEDIPEENTILLTVRDKGKRRTHLFLSYPSYRHRSLI